MSLGQFNETDHKSWYFGDLKKQEAVAFLQDEEVGTFLVRDSSSLEGEYVLCVKDKKGVVQYIVRRSEGASGGWYLREEMVFPDLSSLLCFYKTNLLGTTPLVKPSAKVPRVQPRSHKAPRSPREAQSMNIPHVSNTPDVGRASVPPGFGLGRALNGDPEFSGNRLQTPVYVRVTKNKRPSAYDIRALELRVGEVIQVTNRSSTGNWTGIANGKEGSFPFTHVEELSPEEVEQHAIESPD